MMRNALATCDTYHLLEDGDCIVVALSGGADSTALLHLLFSIKETYHLTLFAAHLNHGIRGEEAARDERFCKILCENYDIPFTAATRDIPSLAAERHISEELCGREERYAFLEEVAERYNAKIATAHNADDNAETLLFRLARGTSLRGAAGIPPRRGRIIRPLIETTRAQIETYCEEHGLNFVTDSSNLADRYARNQIRHHVVPTLRELNPAFETAVLRFTQSASEIAEWLGVQAEAALETARTDTGYRSDVLQQCHPAVWKAALDILLRQYALSVDARRMELLAKLLRHGGAVQLSQVYTAVCRRKIFSIVSRAAAEIPEKELADRVSFHCHGMRVTASVDPFFCHDPWLFRTRRPGDTFSFSERNITKPLGKALRDRHIPAPLRDRLLCLCEGSTVLWCEALGYAAQGKKFIQTHQLTIELTEEKCYDVTQGREIRSFISGKT